MKKLATIGLLLFALVAQPATAQELLGDPELRSAYVAPTPPRVVIEVMDRALPWSETATKETVMREVIEWLGKHMDLPLVHDLPRLSHAAPATLSAMRYRTFLSSRSGQNVPAAQGAVEHTTVAIYMDDERTIYLPNDFTGRTPRDLSILVHEMVHHIQNVAGLRYECPRAREKLAYLAQQRWLNQFGKGLESEFGIDPFTVLVNGLCVYD